MATIRGPNLGTHMPCPRPAMNLVCLGRLEGKHSIYDFFSNESLAKVELLGLCNDDFWSLQYVHVYVLYHFLRIMQSFKIARYKSCAAVVHGLEN